MGASLFSPSRRFTPDSALWRIHREWLICLSGSRALLLELAHPLIAAGVAEHSNYRGDPFGRLVRTLRTMTYLSFAEPEQARRAARHMQRCHAPVAGRLAARVGPFSAGTEYAANDPFLRLWVLATLIDSNLLVYDLFIAPLTPEDRQAYYQDCRTLAQWMGLPPACMPATYADFAAYVQAMIQSDQLSVNDTARDIAAALYSAPVFGRLARYGSFAGIGLLPERIRADFGFSWDAGRTRWLERLARWSRRVRPFIPDVLAINPLAWRMERRAWAGQNLQYDGRTNIQP